MMFIWLWLSAMTAWAGELEFGYSPSLGTGEQPMLSVTVPRSVDSIWIQIEAGGSSWDFERSGMGAGEQFKVHWERNPAVTEALATIRCEFSDGYVEAVQVPVSYSYAGRLEVDLSRASADVQKRILTVDVNQPIERADITALGARKMVLDQRTVEIADGPGSIDVPWIGDASEVVLLDVKLHTSNAWAGFTYSPWFLNIPHDDVIFATGQWEIDPLEEAKLHALKQELESVMEKYGSVVQVKLYIGGCTDTVGTAESNRVLSQNRARSIGSWLSRNGISMPIFYYGFGERWLAVPTGDGTDNAANRRAVYMVGANPPPASAGVPSARWSAL
jgi:outer membrane protein OmpA-like peptidoglycan-associated protein